MPCPQVRGQFANNITVEITPFLRSGDNTLELRVANTLANLLEAAERPSGLAGAPRLVSYQDVTFAPIDPALSPMSSVAGGVSGA